MKLLFVIITFFIFSFVNAQTFTISGEIKDVSTGELLLYADCYDVLSQKGTTTNAFGHYSLGLSQGTILLTASYLGYKSFEKKITLTKDSIINISLMPKTEQLDDVILNKSIPVHKQTLMGKITVPVSSIKAMPSFVGETDVMKSLTYLPGITGGKEGYSNIFVRGGDRGQNLILLDGIKLYNTNHIGGMLSLFNSDIIKQVDLYKGGFPSRYGGRASSVIDVFTKNGNSVKTKGKFNLGVLTSSILVEGPIKDKVSYYFAARSSYYDLFTLKKRKIYRKTGREGYFGYTLFDINSKINWRISDNNTYSLTFYTGHDYQSAADEVSYHDRSTSKMRIHNTGIALNQFYTLNPKWFLKNTLAYSNYSNWLQDYEKNDDFIYEYSTVSNINEISWQTRFEYKPNTFHTINTGLETSYYRFKPSEQHVLLETENESNSNNSGYNNSIESVEGSVYIEDEMKISNKLRLNLGLRSSIYIPKDTVFYRFEPRVSFRWLVNEDLSVKANYTRMNQFNHALINNYQGFEKEIWLAATKKLIPQKADQFSSGIFYSKKDSNWKFSLETYYKVMTHLLEYHSPLNDEDNTSNLEENVITNGKGEAYGVETQIAKQEGRFTGSLSYTLAWNYRQFEALNKGKSYPFIYDRRHNISLFTRYKLSKSYTLNSNFTLSTGTPVTLPEAYIAPDANSSNYGYFVINSINNRRLPLYHRLDVSVVRTRKNKKGNKRQVSLNLFNIYARQNPIHIYYDRNTGQIKQKSIFSIIPTLNLSYEY